MSSSNKTWIDNSAPTCDADDLNGFQNENNNAILGSGQTLSSTDREQTSKALSAFSSGGDFYTCSGVANTYVLTAVTPRLGIAALQDGMKFTCKINASNTSSSTININSLGAKDLVNINEVAFSGGEVSTDDYIIIIYDLSSDKFKLLSIYNPFTLDNRNNFVVEPTTNTSYASSDAVNPFGYFFDDLKPRYGKNRYMFAGIVAIEKGDNMPSYDSDGLQGFHPIDARTGKPILWIGLYGSWEVDSANDAGIRIQTSVSTDYFLFTEIFNEACVLSLIEDATIRNTDNIIYLDGFTADDPTGGTDTTNDLNQQGNDVLNDNNYATNQTQKLDLNTPAQGIHTVKVENGTDGSGTQNLVIYGIELVNELTAATQEIAVTSGKMNIQGKEVSIAAQVGASSLNIAEGIVGSKGGFVGYYIDKSGTWQNEKQEPEKDEQAGVAEYNAAASDSISGLTDSSKFFANSQGNISRLKITADTDKSLLLVPTAAADANNLTLANDYDGVADTTLFAGNKQFEPDGTTGVVIADQSAITIELYAKIGVNADHSNEEPLQRRIGWDSKNNKRVSRDRWLHFRDFGNQLSDDFTSLRSASDRAFTMDDGSSTLVANDVIATGSLKTSANGAFIEHTFYGVGLDIDREDDASGGADTYDFYIDGVKIFVETAGDLTRRITKICSDLPLGDHVFKVIRTAAATWNIGVYNFITYLPKQPALTENYDYHTYNYVLADQVLTSLPTLELAAYNGAIDQGVIRKSNVRESVYTGAFTYQASVASGFPSGRNIYSSTNNDTVEQEIYGSDKIRNWVYYVSAADNLGLSIDGAAAQTFNPANVNHHGWIYDGANYADLGTEGLHNIESEQDGGNGNMGFSALDYHCPIYNPDQWRINPEPSRLIDGQGVIDNRKFSAYDEKPVNNIRSVNSNIANGTFISSSETLLFSLVLDAGTWDLVFDSFWLKATTNAYYCWGAIYIDGVLLRGKRGSSRTAGDYIPIDVFDTVAITKRQAVTVVMDTNSSSAYQWDVGISTMAIKLIATKISEDD